MRVESVISKIADFTQDAVLIADAHPVEHPGPVIIWCNPAFTAMKGFAVDQIVGKTPRILQGADTNPAACQAIRESPTH